MRRPGSLLALTCVGIAVLTVPPGNGSAASSTLSWITPAQPQSQRPVQRVPLSVDELVDRQQLPFGSTKVHWFPDSRRVLLELAQPDFSSTLHVFDTVTGRMRDLGPGFDAVPSPAGDLVGHLGDDGQVWVVGADGTGGRRVTHASAGIWSFTFAGPDAVVYTTVVRTPAPPLPPAAPGASVTQIGAYPTSRTEFFLQPIRGGVAKPRRLGSEDGFVYGAMTYVPSRQEIVYPLDSDILPDATAPAEVHAMSVRTGAPRTVVEHTGGQWLIPTVLPDGNRVAFPMAAVDTGYPTYQDVGLVSLDGGPPRRLTDGPMHTGDLMAPVVGDRIAFRCKDSVYTRICVTPTNADTAAAPTLVGRPDREIAAFTGSADGARLAWITFDPHGRSALEVATVARPTRITTRPLPGLADPGVPLGAVREVKWDSDGLRLSGLVVTPPDYRHGNRYPVVVDLHGGPAGGTNAQYGGSLLLGGPIEWQLWATRGYVVFVPDYRESGMYGWDPIAEARGQDFLRRDVDDVMRGIDALAGAGLIDTERMALVGHSYGALLGNFLLTRVDRFRTAVLHEGTADLWLVNSVHLPGKGWAEWQQGGPPWDPQAQRAYLDNEALLSAGSYRTPTLFLAGELALGSDVLNYSWKYMYTSLRRRGIDTELLIYGGEGHVLFNPANKKDSMLRSLSWITERVPTDGVTLAPAAQAAAGPAVSPQLNPGRCARLRQFTLTAPGGGPPYAVRHDGCRAAGVHG